MVMLDIFQHDDIVVAHFNHGTRQSAETDASFVGRIVKAKRLTYSYGEACLGEQVSEETARTKRYEFLRETRSVSKVNQIYTAHHLDDLVESIAINLIRGTGWRGLAVLDAPGVRRPFLEPELLPENLRAKAPFDKKAIYKYATQHNITFRQDPTNYEDQYLRNRVRVKLENFTDKLELYNLWQAQKKLKTEIDEIVNYLLPKVNQPWQREWFRDLDQKVALELLRAGTMRAGVSATRPQLEDFRQAILTYKPGKSFNLPGDKLVRLSKTEFYL